MLVDQRVHHATSIYSVQCSDCSWFYRKEQTTKKDDISMLLDVLRAPTHKKEVECPKRNNPILSYYILSYCTISLIIYVDQNDLLWYYHIHSYPTNPDSWLPWSILIMLGRPYQCHGSYGTMGCPVQVALRVLCRMADVLDGHSVSWQLERDGRGKLWKTSRCVVNF